MTRALIEQLVDAMNTHGSPYLGHIEEYQAALIAAREYLAQPNTQEPCAWRSEKPDEDGEIIFATGVSSTMGWRPLYDHPAPQQPREPVELLATDEFYSWWEENPSLGQQQALVQFYDKHPAPQTKPLTGEQIDVISLDWGMTGIPLVTRDLLQFARAIEAAHGVKP